MRDLAIINAEIEATKNERQVINKKLNELYKERDEYMKANFEKDHSLKCGDLVELRNGKHVYYDGYSPDGIVSWVYCRKPKKDGLPSRSVISMFPEAFTDCKVIGHAELPD